MGDFDLQENWLGVLFFLGALALINFGERLVVYLLKWAHLFEISPRTSTIIDLVFTAIMGIGSIIILKSYANSEK